MKPEALDVPSRRVRWIVVVTIPVFLAAFTAFPLGALPASRIPVCGFHLLSGLPCPLCGGTRAAQAALRGDWAMALYLNPLALVVVTALIFFVATALTELILGRTVLPWAAWRRVRGALIPALLVGLLVWWPVHLVSALRTPKKELIDLRNPVARAVYFRVTR